MAISMKKKRDSKEIVKMVVTIVLALVLAIAVVAFLPIPFEVKKLLFFILIIVFAILGVIISNKRK